MLSLVKFSIPLWPGLSPKEIVNDLYPFLEECGDIVSDLYFTCRIKPFDSDAMGGIIVPEEREVVINNAFVISEQFGIPISATFNNIHSSPSYQNYLIFIENLKPLYDKGLRVITIPHTSWLKFGLKDKFPELFVKNTILHRVNTAAETHKLFEAGFDYINLDRNLIRDFDMLDDIKSAKMIAERDFGRTLYTSLLFNEMCEGYCPIQNDHFAYNINRTINDEPFFHSEFGNIAPCKVKNEKSTEWLLKSASIPTYYSVMDHLSDRVDIFKMHGRESRSVFYNTLEIVRQFKQRTYINDDYRKSLSLLDEKQRAGWFKLTQTCKFNCWKCSACEDLAKIINIRKKKDV